VDGIEERWRMRFGGDVIDALHMALIGRMTPMPWSPPEVAPSDGFCTHIVAGGYGDDTELPLVALLGQALTSLTLEHEQNSEVSLPLGANFLRVIDSGVVRIRDLPAIAGVSKEGVAMGTSFLVRGGLAARESERAITLTPDGLDAFK
jgi:hypothetical protein